MNVRRQSHTGPRGLLLTVLLLIAAQTVVAAHLHEDALPDAGCVVCSSGHADKLATSANIQLDVPPKADALPAPASPVPPRTTTVEAPRVRGPPRA